MDKKIWLLEHPITQYNEDVKNLALRNNLKIFDPKVIDVNPDYVEQNPPKVTKKSEEALVEDVLKKTQMRDKKTIIK